MQTGEVIVKRRLVALIREISQQSGIDFSTYSDDWVIELEKSGVKNRILGYKFSLNDAVAAAIADDKVAAHQILDRSGVDSLPHVLLRSPFSGQKLQEFERWGEIVVKPLDGSGGYGVKKFADTNLALDWLASTGHPAWAVSPYVDIAREIRIVMLDGRDLLAYEKRPVMIDGLKMFNLGRGATPVGITPTDDLLQLAASAQRALGLRLSSVDIIETADGKLMVLEVNSGIMMEHYLRLSDEHYRRAVKVYQAIIEQLFAQ